MAFHSSSVTCATNLSKLHALRLLFLLYLEYKLAKNKTRSINDPILGKTVSVIVFIKNKQLYEEA